MIKHIRTKGELDSALAPITGRKYYQLDCETNGLSAHKNDLLLLQVGTVTDDGDPEDQLVIDVNKVGLSNLHPIREVIGENTIIGHNIKFDLKFLKQKLGWEFTQIYDTMIAEKVIYSGYPQNYRYDLATVLWRRAKVRLDKETRDEFIDKEVGGEFSSDAIEYSGLDVTYLYYVMKEQKNDIYKHKLDIVLELELSMLAPLADIELNGFRIDVEGWRNTIKVFEGEAIELRKELNLLTGYETEINWNSPKQVVAAINDKYPEVGLTSSSKESLEAVGSNELVETLLEYRKKNKFVTSFGESLLEMLHEGKLHTNFGLVATGRMSSSKPNMQQMPSTNLVRSMFIADRGYKLVTADYGSQELVILASNSGEPAWLHALEHGKDLHSISASMLYRSKWDAAEEEGCDFSAEGKKCSCEGHKEMRNAAKAISFSLAYGAGAHALSRNLGISVPEAENLMDDFFAALPNVYDYLEDRGKFACDYGYSVTNKPISRKRFYPFFSGLSWGAINRRGKNSVIQGTAADQTKLAIIGIDTRIKLEKWDATIVAVVHDEIVCQAEESIAEQFAEVVKREMELAGKVTLGNSLLKTFPNVSDVWSK